jgi:hypothetical protein
VPVEQQVLGLQVAVDDVVRVQVVQRERDFGRVELCDRVGKALWGSVVAPAFSFKSRLPGTCAVS